MLHSHVDLVALEGDAHLERVQWRNNITGVVEARDIRHVFFMIGAVPNTRWLEGCVALDSKGFVKTGTDLSQADLVAAHWPLTRAPFVLETSLPGVFAVGDVRSSSMKRVASAVGEGASAVALVHQSPPPPPWAECCLCLPPIAAKSGKRQQSGSCAKVENRRVLRGMKLIGQASSTPPQRAANAGFFRPVNQEGLLVRIQPEADPCQELCTADSKRVSIQVGVKRIMRLQFKWTRTCSAVMFTPRVQREQSALLATTRTVAWSVTGFNAGPISRR